MRAARVLGAVLAIALCGCGGGAQEDSSTRGGEASIVGFGSEARGSERAAILGAFSGYLTAIAEEDYATACSRLSATVQSSLARLAGQGSKAACTTILPKLLAPSAVHIARRQAEGGVAKVRVEGARGFVVFHAPGARLYMLTMAREGARWKATTIAASVLVPSVATLGQ